MLSYLLTRTQLSHEAGIPPGVFNVLTASRESTPALVQALTSSQLVAKLSFTGSTAIGKVRGYAMVASNPGLPRPDFILHPWRKIGEFFLLGCEIKSGRGRPGFEAIAMALATVR